MPNKWEYEAIDYEDYLRVLRKMASFLAEKAAIIQDIEAPLRGIQDKILGQIGFAHTFIEEAYIRNRVELSGAARQLDEAEKLLRQQIHQDVSRIRDLLDSILTTG